MRKRPKFQVGDIVEEFYFDYDVQGYISIYHIVVKRQLKCWHPKSRNKYKKWWIYTFKALDNGEIASLSDKLIRSRNEYRKVA